MSRLSGRRAVRHGRHAGRLRAGLGRGAAGAGALARRVAVRPGPAGDARHQRPGVGRHRAPGRRPAGRRPGRQRGEAHRRGGRAVRRGLVWRPGARELVDAVRAAGIPTALVTNTERRADRSSRSGRWWTSCSTCRSAGTRSSTASRRRTRTRRRPRCSASRRRAAVAIEDSPTGVASAAAAGCAVLVVPAADVPVPPGPGRTFADSLVGITVADLTALVARAA